VRNVAIKNLYRILDANFNRAKEGLRVCEDICRFFLNEKGYTQRYKTLRHRLSGVVTSLSFKEVVLSRDVLKDIGKQSLPLEFDRKSVKDIFYANSQRGKESLRVLEEFAKLVNIPSAKRLKKIRYELYDLEKGIVQKF
jgi:thiamine-phosphate pyrophosphorylase